MLTVEGNERPDGSLLDTIHVQSLPEYGAANGMICNSIANYLKIAAQMRTYGNNNGASV